MDKLKTKQNKTKQNKTKQNKTKQTNKQTDKKRKTTQDSYQDLAYLWDRNWLLQWLVKVPWSSFGSGIGRKWKERITARTSHCNFDNCYILSLFWWIYFHLWFSVSVWKGSKPSSKLVDIGWLWVSQKTAIIMEGEIKDKHNTLFIPKVIRAKGCSSSYNLWKCYVIGTFYTEVASTYSTTPYEPFCPRTKKGTKCSKWLVLIKTPYKLTFSIQ